jgi:hypothetical protein
MTAFNNNSEMKPTGSKIKLSRQLGIPLTSKAIKYLERRPYPPGEHGDQKIYRIFKNGPISKGE